MSDTTRLCDVDSPEWASRFASKATVLLARACLHVILILILTLPRSPCPPAHALLPLPSFLLPFLPHFLCYIPSPRPLSTPPPRSFLRLLHPVLSYGTSRSLPAPLPRSRGTSMQSTRRRGARLTVHCSPPPRTVRSRGMYLHQNRLKTRTLKRDEGYLLKHQNMTRTSDTPSYIHTHTCNT